MRRDFHERADASACDPAWCWRWWSMSANQFLSTTWDEAKSALNLKDFSPASQEAAGKYLTQRRGVDTSKVYTNIGDFTKAINKLAPEWASLPYQGVSPSGHGNGSSYYGQGGIDTNQDLIDTEMITKPTIQNLLTENNDDINDVSCIYFTDPEAYIKGDKLILKGISTGGGGSGVICLSKTKT